MLHAITYVLLVLLILKINIPQLPNGMLLPIQTVHLVAHDIPLGAFLGFLGEVLPNHSYVDLSLVGGINSGAEIVCHTDLSTCCGGVGYNDRGNWFFPNGDQLPAGFMDMTAAPFVERRNKQRVELRRGSVSGDIPSGIYLCSIETVAVHSDDFRERVYVGVYGSGGEHIIIILK